MNNYKRIWCFKIHFIFSLVIAVGIEMIGRFFNYDDNTLMKIVVTSFNHSDDTSAGVIGGADGPTAIFLATSNTSEYLILNIISILLFIFLLIMYKPIKVGLKKILR